MYELLNNSCHDSWFIAPVAMTYVIAMNTKTIAPYDNCYNNRQCDVIS